MASARERALARKYEGFPRTEAQKRRLAKLQALYAPRQLWVADHGSRWLRGLAVNPCPARVNL